MLVTSPPSRLCSQVAYPRAFVFFPWVTSSKQLAIIEDKQTNQKILAAGISLTQKQESLRRLRLLLARAPVVTPASRVCFTEGDPKYSPRNASRVLSPDKRVTEADVEALESAVLKLKGQIKSLNQSIFDTFEQSLAPSLQVQYRTIVQEQCDSDSYVTLEWHRGSKVHLR